MWFWFIGSWAQIRSVELTYGAFHPKGCWQTSCSHSLRPKINTFVPSAMTRLRRDAPASDHAFCVPFVSPVNELSCFSSSAQWVSQCECGGWMWVMSLGVASLGGVLSWGHKTSGEEAIRVWIFILQKRRGPAARTLNMENEGDGKTWRGRWGGGLGLRDNRQLFEPAEGIKTIWLLVLFSS